MNKKKMLLIPLVIILLIVSMTPSVVQAKPIIKDVTTEILDGPFPPGEPEPNLYGKGVMQSITIVKSVNWNEGSADVILKRTMAVRLYELIPTSNGGEPGDFLFLLEMTGVYEGTLVPGVNTMLTGTMVEDWVINEVGDIQFPTTVDLRGHWVTKFENGEVVFRIGFGVSPFN